MVSPDAAPGPAMPGPDVPAPNPPSPAVPSPAAALPAAGGASAREPVLPQQSPEDTDAAWGEYPSRDDDRLYRDRPPHWDDI